MDYQLLTPSVVSWRAAISAYEKGEQWDMRKASSGRESHWITAGYGAAIIILDVMSWSAAISACEKGKQWEKALGLLLEMVRKLLTPNAPSWSAVISACEKDEQWEGAFKLLQ